MNLFSCSISWQSDDDDDEFTENQEHKIADAINLLPRFADGVNVNIRFRRLINMILSTPPFGVINSLITDLKMFYLLPGLMTLSVHLS